MTKVNFDALEEAHEFVSSTGFNNEAFVARDTGEIYWKFADGESDEDLPEDIDDPDRCARAS